MSSVEKTFDQVANLVVTKREAASDGIEKAFALGVRVAGLACTGAILALLAAFSL